MARKRKSSVSNLEGSPKRSRKESTSIQPEAVIIESYAQNDEDLDIILALIKEQEESELLAKKLQEEWNSVPGSSTTMAADNDIRGDEVLALRLAQEWNQDNHPHDNNNHSLGLDDYTAGKPGISSPQGNITTINSCDDDTPDKKLSEFRSLFTKKRECTKCHRMVNSPRGYVMFTGELLPPSLTLLMHAPCSSCKTNHCRGCFIPITCPISCKGPSKNKNCKITSCCAESRAIAIFEMLGGFDRQYINERATSDSRSMELAKKKPIGKNSVGPGGTGYGTESIGGYGPYDGRSRKFHSQTQQHGSSRMEKLAAHWDEIVIRALNALALLLPSPYAEPVQDYDLVPHPSIGPLLSLSKLSELLAGLLRNDSVTDWIERNGIYHAMISLLRRMADCELTIEVLIRQRWEMSEYSGLESWMWGESDIVWAKTQDGTTERAPPLYDYFQRLIKQCEAFQAGASQIMGTESNEGPNEIGETVVQAASLCGDIIAAKSDMDRVMSVLVVKPTAGDLGLSTTTKNEGMGEGKNNDMSLKMNRTYVMACEKLAFRYIMLGIPEDKKGKGKGLNYSHYNYAQQLEKTHTVVRAPGYRFHLVKELAVMATSLPPGVWVRADEVRNDAIKIMIAGPQGTPYAGGLFEFDCFIPPEYPNTPPLMHLRTTGGGSVRFNPNLYSCGKVCLSLLGTWPGRPEEQWSSKSTLLQVLVSIQSMIFIDTPYYNEPGHGQANPRAQVSLAYNKEVSLNTVRWAIVEWFKDEHRHGIWRDVISSHFGTLRGEIRARIVEWAASDTRICSCFPGVYSLSGIPTMRTTSVNQPLADFLREFDLSMDRIQAWDTTSEVE